MGKRSSLRHTFRFLVVLILVSGLLQSSKLLAQGSEEASSPEDSNEAPPPSLELFANDKLHSDLIGSFNPVLEKFDGTLPPRDRLQAGPDGELNMVSPLLTPSVFPYTPDPFTAIISVGLTMAFMSWKETGEVNWEGIKKILNNTDLYAGITGSVSAGVTQRGVAVGAQALVKRVTPQFMKPVTDASMMKILGNIVNGFTYVFAVSSGYEYFSQIWKVATKHSPDDVRTFNGFLNAGWATQRRVIQNIQTVVLFQPDMHKRIRDSVWNHRILTYEFIATNVGLYVGMMLGRYLSLRYSPKVVDKAARPWLASFVNYLGTISGGITGGLAVQLTPESWRIAINSRLLNHKIRDKEDDLVAIQASVEEAIEDQVYPPRDRANLGSYFLLDGNLESDVNRVLRSRDLLLSLYMQNFFVDDKGYESLDKMHQTLDGVEDYFIGLKDLVDGQKFGRSRLSVDLYQGENPSGVASSEREKYRRHYSIILGATIERLKETAEEYNMLFTVMEQTLQQTES